MFRLNLVERFQCFDFFHNVPPDPSRISMKEPNSLWDVIYLFLCEGFGYVEVAVMMLSKAAGKQMIEIR